MSKRESELYAQISNQVSGLKDDLLKELKELRTEQINQGKIITKIEEHSRTTNGAVGRAFKEIEEERKKREGQIIVCSKAREVIEHGFKKELEPLKRNTWIAVGVISLATVIINIALAIYF